MHAPTVSAATAAPLALAASAITAAPPTVPTAAALPALSTIPPKGELVAKAVDRKSTRLNSSHGYISYAVFCLKKKKRPQAGASVVVAARAVFADHLVPARAGSSDSQGHGSLHATDDQLHRTPPHTLALAHALR